MLWHAKTLLLMFIFQVSLSSGIIFGNLSSQCPKERAISRPACWGKRPEDRVYLQWTDMLLDWLSNI